VQELEAVQALVAELQPLGVYLYGSAVHGGLKPRSDLDVFVVTRRRTTETEKRRLVEGLRAITGRNVEVTITADGAAYMDFQWGGWLPDGWEEGENPDLQLLIHQVRERSRTLHGPPPTELLPAIAPEDLRRAMFDSVDPIIGGLHEDPTNAILALCRMLCTLVTGEFVPKDVAAEWTHARFPHAAIAKARATYLGGLPEDYTGLDLEYVAANLRALIAQQDRP
jgi:streptomycin 3"-adenylyltransferase